MVIFLLLSFLFYFLRKIGTFLLIKNNNTRFMSYFDKKLFKTIRAHALTRR